jgi:hypothetical protein
MFCASLGLILSPQTPETTSIQGFLFEALAFGGVQRIRDLR